MLPSQASVRWSILVRSSQQVGWLLGHPRLGFDPVPWMPQQVPREPEEAGSPREPEEAGSQGTDPKRLPTAVGATLGKAKSAQLRHCEPLGGLQGVKVAATKTGST